MHPPATAILSCFLELHLNSSCSPGTSHIPQSREYLTEASASLCFCHDCSLKAFLISCFGSRLCRCLSFPGLFTFLPSFRTWVFSPPLLSTLLLHPPSFSPSLAFVSTMLWLLFSHSHSSLSIPVDDPVDLSCIYFWSARGSDSQAGGVISSCGCSSSLRSMLSMLLPASCHQPSHHCSLYCSRTSSLRNVWLSLGCFRKQKLPLPGCLHLFPCLASSPLSCTDCAVTPL